ncbi:helix-turn-helix transcriptional regulator [Crenobacter sp. SG2305]|uniref:helix-turn-helix domain-containing protein n=1 Tax=Crenobacter oryzisoli TaxID=3056844 RepID=UPI0025AA7370|nr:helix-turn-helix transcriptional regulator [Crenobacter sp. SG2305]MDN0081630.1 helix-turn-helix transcriptional regulator [Crenobacter sp. SG2305]
MRIYRLLGIGERLLEERRRLNLSQTEMGKLGGVSLNTYYSYEKGTRKPDSDFFEKVYVAGVDVLYVVAGVRNNASLNNDESALLAQYNKLDARMRSAVLALMQTYNSEA